MTPELSCSGCGGNRFAYPFKLTDNAVIHCEECGATVGTFAELREKVAGQIDQGNLR